MQYLSREGVQLRTVHPDGQPWLHLQNPNAFLAPDRHCLEVPRYNFLLVDPEQDTLALNREEILRRYGSPREKVRAGCYEVWLYDGLIAQAFTLFLRSTLAQRCREQLPSIGPERPASLARPERNFATGRPSRRVELTPGGEVTVAFAGPVRGSLLDLGGTFDGH